MKGMKGIFTGLVAFAFMFVFASANASNFEFDVSGGAVQGSSLTLNGAGNGHQIMLQSQSASAGFVNGWNYSPIGEVDSTQGSASWQRSNTSHSGVRTTNSAATSFEVGLGNNGVFVGNSSGASATSHTYGNASGYSVSGSNQNLWFDLP